MNIELPILGFLQQGPMHGYQIMERLDTILGFAWRPSYGSLYPMLKHLVKRGFIIKGDIERSHGPNRQVYSITPEGRDRLRDLLLSKPTPIGLPMQILFFDQLSEEERKSFLKQAQEQRQTIADRMKERATITGNEPLNKYQLLLMDYGHESLLRYIAWLKKLERE